MAFPSIDSHWQGNGESGDTTIEVTGPATVNADDLLLIIIVTSDTESASSWPSGFTELIDSSSTPGLHVAYHWADGDEDSASWQVTMSGTNDAFSAFTLAIGGADKNTNPEFGTVETDLDHGGVSPSWGSGEDSLFIAVAGTYAFGDPAHSSYPSGWTTFTDNEQHTTYFLGNLLQIAAKQSTAASEDPGTFAVTGGTSPAYKSTTIVVRPGGGTTLTPGQSLETDSPLTGEVVRKAFTVGQCVETDSGLEVPTRYEAGQSLETGTALAVADIVTRQVVTPDADKAGSTGWERFPASGGFYDKVDEANPNGDTDYVYRQITSWP